MTRRKKRTPRPAEPGSSTEPPSTPPRIPRPRNGNGPRRAAVARRSKPATKPVTEPVATTTADSAEPAVSAADLDDYFPEPAYFEFFGPDYFATTGPEEGHDEARNGAPEDEDQQEEAQEEVSTDEADSAGPADVSAADLEAYFFGPYYFEPPDSDVSQGDEAHGNSSFEDDLDAESGIAEPGVVVDDDPRDDFAPDDFDPEGSEDRGDEPADEPGDGETDWTDDWEDEDWEDDWEDDPAAEQSTDRADDRADEDPTDDEDQLPSYDEPEVERHPRWLMVASPPALEPERPAPLGAPRVLGLVGAGLALLVAGVIVFLVLGRGPDPTAPTPLEHAVGFHPPVAVPANGEYVRARVLPTGDLAVDHWIRSTALIFELTLTAPQGEAARPKLVASQVTVQTDGQTVSGPSSVSTKAGSYSFIGAKEVHVSYVLYGAVSRSGTGGHRALARVTALDVSYGSDRGPSTVSVVGGRVLALACSSSAPAARPHPCGTQASGAWHVDLSPSERHDRVMAQLDLG